MSNDTLKINRADFSLDRKQARQDASAASTVKSSYEMDAVLHRRLRMLAVNTGRKLNVLFEEAVSDLLSKYGG